MRRLISIFSLLFISLLAGITYIFFAFNRPPDKSLFIDPLDRIETDKRVVALTFDDGPSSARTPRLLEVLTAHNTNATFFMLGKNIEKYPQIAASVVDNGHLVGNHSYSHVRMIFKTPWFIKRDIERVDSLIRGLGQQEVGYYRPPYGDKMIVLPLLLKAMDKKMVTFDIQTMAEYREGGLKSLAEDIVAKVRPGSIIVLHDGKDGDAEEYADQVKKIITDLRAQNYEFVTIEELESYGAMQ